MAKVSKRLRFEILRRDNHQCRYCGAGAPDVELRIDHVIPEALGGPTMPDNLVTACEPCNSGKSSMAPDAPVVDDVALSALRWRDAMRAAAATLEAELAEEDARNDAFRAEWARYTITGTDQSLPLPADWEASVTRLRAAGLTDQLMSHAVAAAMGAAGVQPENRFRYFCGVAWNQVNRLQEAARQIVDNTPHAGGSETPVSFYDSLSADEIAFLLWRFDSAAEDLLERVPLWIHEQAERRADGDWRDAGDPHAARELKLPTMLAHVGDILRDECDVRLADREDV